MERISTGAEWFLDTSYALGSRSDQGDVRVLQLNERIRDATRRLVSDSPPLVRTAGAISMTNLYDGHSCVLRAGLAL